uniref:Putative conserved plasma membrane protein n=1 Tax=Ixodes ricinus TaxID=34613 RepID=A0A6B0U5Q1_IXORI
MGATSRCPTAKRPNHKTNLLAEGLRNARSRSDPPVDTTAAPPRTSGIFPCRRRIPLLLSSMRSLFHRLVAGMSTGHFFFPYFINCICFFSDLKY